jgi:hypothetical protein
LQRGKSDRLFQTRLDPVQLREQCCALAFDLSKKAARLGMQHNDDPFGRRCTQAKLSAKPG